MKATTIEGRGKLKKMHLRNFVPQLWLLAFKKKKKRKKERKKEKKERKKEKKKESKI